MIARVRQFRGWAALLVLAACGPREDLVRLDQNGLRSLLEADMVVADVLRRADELTVAGQGRQAAAVLEHEAGPQASANAERAHALSPLSPWGRSRSSELVMLLDDRRASIDAYAAALKNDDVEKVVATLEASKLIERRGIALTDAVKTAPVSKGGCGG